MSHYLRKQPIVTETDRHVNVDFGDGLTAKADKNGSNIILRMEDTGEVLTIYTDLYEMEHLVNTLRGVIYREGSNND